MAKKDDENVVKIKRQSFHFNIGMLVFIIILIYTLYFAVRYFTTEHIMAYEVEEGTIVQNTTYTGIALRDEKIYYCSTDGIIDYYVTEGSRVSVRSLLYSIDDSGVMSDFLENYGDEITELDSDTIAAFDDYFNEYNNSYEDEQFSSVYSFKKSTEDKLTENKNQKALSYLTASGDATGASLQFVYASEPGVVVYQTDGYENVSLDSINTYMFRKSNYVSNTIANGSQVSNGSVAYKMITSEDWDLIVPIDYEMAEELTKLGAVEIQFLKDNIHSYATVEILYKSDGAYADFKFSNSMVRYCSDRFLDIKIITDQKVGLKIPNSSIVEKEFFLVPKEYLTMGGDSSENGFMKESSDEDGNLILLFVPCEIYHETDEYYYITNTAFESGDVLRLSNSTERFILSKTDTLRGVYCINKGYAVFKRIDRLYDNEEYTIVAKNTKYGLSQFDYIAIDASDLYEGEVVQ